MPTYTYYSTIPQAGDDPSISQAQILQNFSSIDDWCGTDHYSFGTGDDGYHNQVTFPVATSPVPTAAGPLGVLYTVLDASSTSQLVFKNKDGITELTSGGGGPAIFEIRAGTGTGTSAGTTPVTFSTPFTTSCVAVVASTIDNSQARACSIVQGSISTTGFRAYTPNSSNSINYVAIGT